MRHVTFHIESECNTQDVIDPNPFTWNERWTDIEHLARISEIYNVHDEQD